MRQNNLELQGPADIENMQELFVTHKLLPLGLNDLARSNDGDRGKTIAFFLTLWVALFELRLSQGPDIPSSTIYSVFITETSYDLVALSAKKMTITLRANATQLYLHIVFITVVLILAFAFTHLSLFLIIIRLRIKT
ncbi:hypothetical protein P171DRAFT_489099 [Karstenula rhodostoma CBS 690.94]|uniref:Uncharacterized protein n=1 Tax=Karstenula rhodostoma CBS 690.94 TaxID=1392251 RepID=A0A9P4PBI9_9PLEO|nr:hypothetical protein P171DRAFT_489099 [Karstenula rhodostoma CBS 690.94]